MTIAFNGTGIAFYAERGPGAGSAGFKIDGGSEVTIDTYSTIEAGNQFVWASSTLASGTHTLTVRVTGQHNSYATGSYVLPDAVQIFV